MPERFLRTPRLLVTLLLCLLRHSVNPYLCTRMVHHTRRLTVFLRGPNPRKAQMTLPPVSLHDRQGAYILHSVLTQLRRHALTWKFSLCHHELLRAETMTHRCRPLRRSNAYFNKLRDTTSSARYTNYSSELDGRNLRS